MRVAAPRPTWLDLRWHLFGASFRVHFLFWPAAAALGWGWHAGPGTWEYLLLWVPCVLLCLLIHEIGQVLAARTQGAHPEAVFFLLGSLTIGIDEVPQRGRRILILLAGPLILAVFYVGVVVLRAWVEQYPPPGGWASPAVATLKNLERFSYWWIFLNLIPLWPLSGGRILGELGDALGPPGRGGVLGVCLFTAFALAFVAGRFLQGWLEIMRQSPLIGAAISLEEQQLQVQKFCILVLFCVLFMARAFVALRAEAQKLPDEETPTHPRS